MKTVAVRLEGGIGDHVLGLRLLPYIRRKFPEHEMIVYSDCGGHRAQLELLTLSPYASKIVPVFRIPDKTTIGNMCNLDNLQPADLAAMKAADIFLDAALWTFFVPQSRILDVPFYEILASRPELIIPAEARTSACSITGYEHNQYVAINLGKYGPECLKQGIDQIAELIRILLRNPQVVVLNVFTDAMDFPHWPEPERTKRREQAHAEAEVQRELCQRDKRVIPVANQPIATVAALLERCSYFIGVDNGIKHIAWALGVPHSVVIPRLPEFDTPQTILFFMRWVPDFHRVLILNRPDDFASHVQAVTAQLEHELVCG